jgi:hypothetical protein
MASRGRSRVPVAVLVFALVAFPAVAEQQQKGQFERGALEVFVEAFAELIPGMTRLVDGLLQGTEEGPAETQPEGDLGSGLDPLG